MSATSSSQAGGPDPLSNARVLRFNISERDACTAPGANDVSGHTQQTAISKIGGLSRLISSPMDVLVEILSHVHPLDLLHLARTTKAFRRVLMHRSSLFVWKATLLTVAGLLDCPPDLSEPQWTHLVFDTHCSLCLRPSFVPSASNYVTKSRNRDLSDYAKRSSVLSSFHRQRWTCDSVIQIDHAGCDDAVAIVKACEMDPSSTTVDEMDWLDARLECLACPVEDPIHVVFVWRSAVKHQREYHWSIPGDWRMLTAGEAEVARAEESGLVGNNPGPKDTMPSDRKIWVCLRCLDGPKEQPWMTLEEVERHLELSHAVVGSQVDRDYVKDFAAPELYATHTLFQAAMVKF